MSWQSPHPPPVLMVNVAPPSSERWKLLFAIRTSSAFAGFTSTRM
jgi:hypothetical protein